MFWIENLFCNLSREFRLFPISVLPIQRVEKKPEDVSDKQSLLFKQACSLDLMRSRSPVLLAMAKSAVRDLKSQLKPASMQARRLLLDPAIHEEFMRLKNLVEEKEKKVKELQDNVAAVNFTPQSKMGKMLMHKCRTLQEENEEIGTLASEGKIHDLAMKLSLQKSQNAELRSQCEGICKHMEELRNDVERSNEVVLTLQQSVEEKDSEIKRLRDELYQKEIMREHKDDLIGDERVTDEANSA